MSLFCLLGFERLSSSATRVSAPGEGFYQAPKIIVHKELAQTEKSQLQTRVGLCERCSLLCPFHSASPPGAWQEIPVQHPCPWLGPEEAVR